MTQSCNSITLIRRSTGSIFPTLLAIALALLSTPFAFESVAAQPAHRMEDPLFGLSFDPRAVRFEHVDALPCETGEVQYPPYFVFAHARRAGAAAWILNHWMPMGGDGERQAHSEPAFGFVLLRSQSKCEVIATPDVLQANPEALESKLARALYRNAARRYVKAYGTAAVLTTELATASARGCLDLALELRHALVRVAVDPPPECKPLSLPSEHGISPVQPDKKAPTSNLNRESASEPTAAETITHFYRAYLPLIGEPARARPELPYSIEFTQMVRRNLALCERLADGICGFGTDGDPYLDGQEFEVPLDFHSAKVQIREGRPGWVEVSLNIYPSAEDSFYDRRIAYQMIRQAGTWVVDDIFYSGVSVRQRIDDENAELLGAER